MPFSDQASPNEEWMDRFFKEVEAIRQNTDTLSETLKPVSEHIQDMRNDVRLLADAYQNAGATRGPGAAAPRIAPEAPSGSPIAPAGSGTSPQASTPKTDAEKTAAQLEKSIGQNASTGGGGFLGRIGQNQGFHLPQFGALTLQNKLEYLGNAAADLAAKRQAKSPTWAEYQELKKNGGLYKPNGDFTDEGQALANQLSKGKGGGLWTTTSGALTGAAHGYAAGKVVMDMAKSASDPFVNARNLGYLTGYTGPTNQGPLGLFNPFGGATAYGLGQKTSEMGFALNNNLSPGQASSIYNNLFGLGWFGGPSTNAMRQGLANLTQANPVLGTDPQVASMMDQATRLGTTSINTFVNTMKQIPQAADAAHVSLAQMVGDAGALGQYYKSIGGNVEGGYQAANLWANATGLPAGVYQQLLQNPMIQGQVFMQSGLLPWEQGLAPFGSQVGGIFRSMDLLRNAVHLPGITQTDSIGLTHAITSNDRVAALMAHQLGISPAAVKNLMNHQTGIQAAVSAQQDAMDYQDRIMGALRKGRVGGPYGAATQLNGAAWNRLYGELQHAHDWNGNRIFGKQALYNIKHAGDQDIFNAVQRVEDRGGKVGARATQLMTQFGKQWIATQGYGAPKTNNLAAFIKGNPELEKLLPKSLIATIAKDRNKAIQGAIGSHTQQANQGPQITIDLSPRAAKMFGLKSNTGSGKAAAGAGSSSVNIPYAQGPSDSPYPNMGTASSYGTSAGQVGL